MVDPLVYSVWVEGGQIGIRVLVPVRRMAIIMMGEKFAVGEAVWDRLWKNHLDANGRETKLRTPSGEFLRRIVYSVALQRRCSEAEAKLHVKNFVLSNMEYRCESIDKEA